MALHQGHQFGQIWEMKHEYFFILDFQSSQKIGDDKILLQNIMSTEHIFLQLFLRE